MISKNIDTRYFTFRDTSFGSYLRKSSVMVKAGEAGNVLFLHCRGVVAEDERISVGGVGDDDTLDIGTREFQRLCLFNKDELIEVK